MYNFIPYIVYDIRPASLWNLQYLRMKVELRVSFCAVNTYSIMTNIMKGADNLNNSNQKPGETPNKLMELMMLNILQKHGITKESVKGKVTDEQKRLIFDLLEELKQQSGSLVDRAKSTSPKTKPK